ncbi:MAG: acetate/propionate family kinase [Patescibacteria group bacterium]|nr:acetate/propionate family kinase [Patescibacteria group bacterium]
MKKILIFNTGSSSIKYDLFEFENEHNINLIKKGLVDRICSPLGPKSYKDALAILFQGFEMGDSYLSKIPDLFAIGHRVVHGGDKYNKTTLIDKNILKDLAHYNLLAPLHNPPIIEVIESILSVSGKKGHRNIPNYAVFDTAFFKDLPEVTKIYPLPYSFYESFGIRRYGFHGISHQYAFEHTKEKYPKAEKIITIHLGSGSSITAIIGGFPIDTSMGFTPLEGLMMATRSGDIDAGIIHYLIETKRITHREVDNILNYQSGLLGISGTRHDVRDLLYLADYPVEETGYKFKASNPLEVSSENKIRAKLALDMYIYRIKKYIGAYVAALDGCDVIVFTGAVGEGSAFLRTKILENLSCVLSNTIVNIVKQDEARQIAKEIISLAHKE